MNKRERAGVPRRPKGTETKMLAMRVVPTTHDLLTQVAMDKGISKAAALELSVAIYAAITRAEKETAA